jgi:hypothetical protein
VSSVFLKKQHLDRLDNFIELETWIKNDENDKEVLSVPKWMSQAFNNIDIESDISEFEKEFKMQQSIKQYRPKHYFEFFKIIFNSPLYNSGICKLHNSTFEISSIELWNGVSDFHWHWDGPGNDDIYALVYLSDYKEWPRVFGAGLEYGVAQLSKQGYKNIERKGVFYPDNGRIVIGDNRNPLQLHRTQHYSEQALIDKIDRITFLVTMKLIPQRHER